MDKLEKFNERGYVVKEAGMVYYTLNMDKTMEWFAKVLGWYFTVDERSDDGNGLYGCTYDIPNEIECQHIVPFKGIHIFFGEPIKNALLHLCKSRV